MRYLKQLLNIFKTGKRVNFKLPVMQFRRLLIMFLICLFCAGGTKAQTPLIDSLKKNIIAATTSENKLKAVLALCEQRQSLNTDTLFWYASLANKMAVDLQDEDDIALSNFFVSNSLSRKGELEAALKITDENLERLSYRKNKNAYTKFSIQKGQLYIKSNRYKEALEHNYKLLNESEQEQDTITQVNVKTSIGWVNMEMGQNTEALSWFYRALATLRSPELFDYTGVIYSNMAATYNELNKNDSAEYFIKKAIVINRQKRNNLQFLANALAIEADIFIDTKRSELAETPMNEALVIRKQIGEPFYIVSDMMQLAIYYANNNQPEKGTALCLDGIEMANKYRLDSKLPILYDALAQNYKAAKNFEKYGETLVKIIALKDSLYEKNSAEALAELQTKYNLQKIQNTIIRQQLDITKKNYLLYGLLVLAIFSLVIAYITFKNYRRKEKMKTELMLQEEKNMAVIAVIEAEEKERKRIAADLHDNLGAYAASIASNIEHIKVLPEDTGNVSAMQELRNNSQSIVSQLNDTIWVLKKNALSLTAISDRLKSFIQRIQSSYPDMKMDVFENITTDHLLPPSQAFHLFQVLQEAINNAVRHSGGKQITVTIESNHSWKITVTDDGKGLPESWPAKEGNGLMNMKNRSKEAGWKIEWQPNNPGTRLSITPTTN
jgi:signal transduction histidine kinase/tetratricopeptide (TPR) repeat protein